MFNKLALYLIRFYQLGISPLLGPRCRFQPTCSEYAFNCFKEFSFLKALWYSTKRIFKCHPFHSGGHDPIPEKRCHH